MRRSLLPLVVLCLAGAVVSYLLVEKHVAASGDSGLCSALAGFSCVEAARSPYSHLGPLNIAAIGFAFYVTFAAMAFLRLMAPIRGLEDVFVGGAGLSVLYSVFLGVQSARGGYLCPYCALLYAVNLGLLVTTVAGHPERLGAVLRRLPGAVTSPGFFVALTLMGLATWGSHGFYVNRKAVVAEALARAQAQNPAPPSGPIVVDPGEYAPKGPADAPVVVVEFSDFECPFCKKLAETLGEVRKRFPDVRVHFRHYPLDQACNPAITRPFHQHACLAAYATVCAQRSGRFWEMHDRLWASSDLARPRLLDLAREVGIDVEAFNACLDDPSTKAAVQRDIAAGTALAITGTPTWFVNGLRMRGGIPTTDELVTFFGEQAKAKAGAPASP